LLEGNMIRHKNVWFTIAGSLVLALGVILWNVAQGSAMHFVSGFLIGMSLALLVGGLARSSRRTSR
jgi:hypothetical protein